MVWKRDAAYKKPAVRGEGKEILSQHLPPRAGVDGNNADGGEATGHLHVILSIQ